MPDLPATEDEVLAFLKASEKSECGYAKALRQVPEEVRNALEKVRHDAGVSTPRIRELLAMHMDKVPSETTVRNHRDRRGCPACDKES